MITIALAFFRRRVFLIAAKTSRSRAALLLAAAGAAAALNSGLSSAAFGANGTAEFFDVNGTTALFGTPTSGTTPNAYDQLGNFWSTSAAGTTAPGAFTSGDQITFGASASDFAGDTFTVNLDQATGQIFNGLVIPGNIKQHHIDRNPKCALTAAHWAAWTVPTGSTLTMDDTRQAFDTTNSTVKGLNWNNQSVTFQGGGTINKRPHLDATRRVISNVENMASGTINLQMGTFTDTTTADFLVRILHADRRYVELCLRRIGISVRWFHRRAPLYHRRRGHRQHQRWPDYDDRWQHSSYSLTGNLRSPAAIA